ncbi:MAG: YpdA family putative bacillithiol disulfide reductase, partial [Vicinamibacterales bacterium]|nr:YpdA family putative bacillithiol disulfide reductase [Vicinamibacterales bacterium]
GAGQEAGPESAGPMMMPVHDLVVIGAGPAGLATAIAATRAGFDYTVIEKGGLVDGVYRFPAQMVFFTTPELLEIGGLPFVTPYDKPTRAEALKYYRRVADAFQLRLALNETVAAVRRGPDGLFRIDAKPDGREVCTRTARAVVFATGYYCQPNLLGFPGVDRPNVFHSFSDPHVGYRKRVVVVGGKNSAAETALELFRAGAHVTLVHRGAGVSDSIKYWVKPDIENRIAEGAIAARFKTAIRAIGPDHVEVDSAAGRESLQADLVFLMTGYHPDERLLGAAGVTFEDEHRVARFDPETQETAVPNLFLAGGVVSGQGTPPVFIENGRLHGDRIVATLRARWGSKDRPQATD